MTRLPPTPKQQREAIIRDRAISISNKINRTRVIKNWQMPLIDDLIARKMIEEYAKENNLDLLVAANRLTMEVSKRTWKGDVFNEIEGKHSTKS